MSVSSVLAVIAGTWGVFMALAPILQMRTMMRSRSSAGVSVAYLSVLMVGFVLWLSYGISLGNPALIITNIVSLTVIVVTIAIAMHYRKDRTGSGGQAADAVTRSPDR
jgi:MtN3 and saliva related transmembrane protein